MTKGEIIEEINTVLVVYKAKLREDVSSELITREEANSRYMKVQRARDIVHRFYSIIEQGMALTDELNKVQVITSMARSNPLVLDVIESLKLV
jgi:hypothetical protein